MPNTEIYLWIEPAIMNHERCSDRHHFAVIVEGDQTELTTDELDSDIVEGSLMTSIMDFANIDSNFNYGVISASLTEKEVGIDFTESPEEREIEEKTQAIIKSDEPIKLTKKNVDIQDGGKLEVNFPALNLEQKIDFDKIWNSIEKNVMGKIQPGDKVELTDDIGNVIFELMGGSFLSIGHGDIQVYDTSKYSENGSFLDKLEALKGGAYIRDDGSIDVGDMERTFYLKIYTNNLLKSSLRLNKSMSEITETELQKYLPEIKTKQ